MRAPCFHPTSIPKPGRFRQRLSEKTIYVAKVPGADFLQFVGEARILLVPGLHLSVFRLKRGVWQKPARARPLTMNGSKVGTLSKRAQNTLEFKQTNMNACPEATCRHSHICVKTALGFAQIGANFPPTFKTPAPARNTASLAVGMAKSALAAIEIATHEHWLGRK